MRIRFLLVFAGALALGLWVASCGKDEHTPDQPPTDTSKAAWDEHATFHVPDPERIPSKLATNPGQPWGDYVGSEACKRCHEEDYHKWRGSFHSRTLYDAVEATVFGDFSDKARFADDDYDWIVKPFIREDPETGRTRYFMDIRYRTVAEDGSGDPRQQDNYNAGYLPDISEVEFEVIYAFGNRRHQPYVIRDKRGLHWVTPVYWDDVVKRWRYDGWRPYVRSCAPCHVTGIKTSENPWFRGQFPIPMASPQRFSRGPGEEGWAEGAVGCEVCHGPGRDHVRAVDAIGVDAYRVQLRAGKKKPTIYDGKRATFDQRLDACGQCHNFHTEANCTWYPGPDGYARDAIFKPMVPPSNTLVPGRGLKKATQFYLDGSHKSPCSAVTVYKKSKMYEEGIGCSDCHDPHGSKHWPSLHAPVHDNSLCIDCHVELQSIEAQTEHSRHMATSPGNRCVECHMPRIMEFTNGVDMMGDKLHSHRFGIPTGIRRPGGPPSACNICHIDRNHRWTQETLARWAAEKKARPQRK